MVGNDWQRKQGSVEVRLMEECAEVIQATSKGIRFGWNNFHPGSNVGNCQIVESEMRDLVTIWNEFAKNYNLQTLKWEK
jgi:hypothetical protein